jgi:hypothetical protein
MLGMINTKTGEEHSIYDNNLDKLGFTLVKRYDGIKDYSLLKQMIKDNEEGFVVSFSNGSKMKIKGVEYVRLHKIMTNITTTGVWEVLSSGGEMDELIKDVPDEFYNKIKDYVKELRYQYHSVKEHAGKMFDSLYESYDGDVIVLVTESTAIGCLHYVEKPTKEEIEELEKSWLDFIENSKERKPTAVEWLVEQVKSVKWKFADTTDRDEIIKQALAMEEEQLGEEYRKGGMDIIDLIG